MKKALLVTLALMCSSTFAGCAAGYDYALDGYDGYYDDGVYYNDDIYDDDYIVGPYGGPAVYEGPGYGVGVNDAGFNY
ncbi:hypothetical protein [Candidatus Epulonipiscium viviparus]|uniref:hypothetical protein n=1 Tax=Candidatus Epulonipiscium viviparus TaxID=420336 RepID=UPI00016C04AF|nr:hypothetical protein [Candidatus Epulopiscium viviparus]